MSDELERRDIKSRRGNTRRESHSFLDEDGVAIVISAYTFVFVIHKLGDPATIYATLTSSFTSTTVVESFRSLAQTNALPTDTDIFEHYGKYTTVAGDVVTFDAGTYKMEDA